MLYLTMEFVQGADLATRLRRDGKMAIPLAVRKGILGDGSEARWKRAEIESDFTGPRLWSPGNTRE